MKRVRVLFALLLLAGCGGPCQEPAPAAPDLGDPLACTSDPLSPCPTGCGCREHDHRCVPNPMTPGADCRRL